MFKKLGEGGFGSVRRDELNGQSVAIKRYKTDISNGIRPEIIREIALMKHMIHPNLIKLQDVWLVHGIEIVMDYGGMNLTQYATTTSLTVRLANFNLVKQSLIDGLQYLHSNGIIHRDLKPGNILVLGERDHTSVRICDFGISKTLSTVNTPGVGTANYRAPELFNGTDYTKAVDIWSLGCCLYEYLTREQLFKGSTDMAIIGNIVRIVPTTHQDLTAIGLSLVEVKSCNTTRYFKLQPLYPETLKIIEQRKQLDMIKPLIESMILLNPNNRFNLTVSIVMSNLDSMADVRFDKFKLSSTTHTTAVQLWKKINTHLAKAGSVERLAGLKALKYIEIACAVIASKFHDIKYLNYKSFVKIAIVKVIAEWELYILRACEWDLYNLASNK